jgi:predicted metal-dependent HD superfamily phosphohydrolase
MFTSGFEFYTGRFAREYDMLASRWEAIFSQVGREDNFLKERIRKVRVSRQFGDLFFRYAENGRFYHTPKHILACLQELDDVRGLIRYPLELEAGLFMHDAFYNTRAKDNEEKSAAYGYNLALRLGASLDFAERQRRIVVITDHKTPPETIEEKSSADIDLSIFGKSEEEFDEYEGNIGKEYAWVPKEQFRKARAEILSYFLARKYIYYTDFFIGKYETRARKNLQSSIERLQRENRLN